MKTKVCSRARAATKGRIVSRGQSAPTREEQRGPRYKAPLHLLGLEAIPPAAKENPPRSTNAGKETSGRRLIGGLVQCLVDLREAQRPLDAVLLFPVHTATDLARAAASLEKAARRLMRSAARVRRNAAQALEPFSFTQTSHTRKGGKA